MSSRFAVDTIRKALDNVPGGVPDAVRESLSTGQWTIKTALDVKTGGKLVLKDTLDSLGGDVFVHVTVAAIYCRCSETTFNRHRTSLGSLSDLEESGDSATVKATVGNQKRVERQFKMRFVRQVREQIDGASEKGDDARSESHQRRHTKQGGLSAALRKKILWFTDADGRVYTTVSLACIGGETQMAKLLRNGARIEVMTFQQAMTERTWVDSALRAPFHDYYLELLDAERQHVFLQRDVTASAVSGESLDSVLPQKIRRGRPSGIRRI